jgi:hypothetical protein
MKPETGDEKRGPDLPDLFFANSRRLELEHVALMAPASGSDTYDQQC